MVREKIISLLKNALSDITSDGVEIHLEIPENTDHGDYSSNVALVLAKKLGKNPRELAEEIVKNVQGSKLKLVDKVEVDGPGFINFWLKNDFLLKNALLDPQARLKEINLLKNKNYMVEYAHPNTHKEMHIGHMRTLITGEALARIFEVSGATVFRANYQGDIGPHVAKAIWGTQKIMEEDGLTLDAVEKWSNADKAHLLGKGYARGSQEYEANKLEINTINNQLYNRDEKIMDIYNTTRQWSLDYYEDFYKKFFTRFDRLFFESEMVESGKRIVEDNIGKIFEVDGGAVVFKGEKYGLHTRVFLTQAGHPTYEGKELGNGFAEWEAFHFDKKVHVVGSEQAGYFQVVFKALELLDPEKFKDKQYHLSMGMVQLVGRKMSSRTGEILRVDELIEEVKQNVEELVREGKLGEDKKEIIETIAIAAVKYSVLKVNAEQNVVFDIKLSVSLDGNSGPYLLYTYTRTQSVLSKSRIQDSMLKNAVKLELEELKVLRSLLHFPEIVAMAASNYAPNLICNYLFDLSQRYNLFYQKHKILGSVQEEFRAALTQAVGQTLQKGLDLLGIKTVEKM